MDEVPCSFNYETQYIKANQAAEKHDYIIRYTSNLPPKDYVVQLSTFKSRIKEKM